jgi:hypothetical protein
MCPLQETEIMNWNNGCKVVYFIFLFYFKDAARSSAHTALNDHIINELEIIRKIGIMA